MNFRLQKVICVTSFEQIEYQRSIFTNLYFCVLWYKRLKLPDYIHVNQVKIQHLNTNQSKEKDVYQYYNQSICIQQCLSKLNKSAYFLSNN
jgi:hypothetical protein